MDDDWDIAFGLPAEKHFTRAGNGAVDGCCPQCEESSVRVHICSVGFSKSTLHRLYHSFNEPITLWESGT